MSHEELKALVQVPLSAQNAILPCHIIPFAQNKGFFMRHEAMQQCRDALLAAPQSSHPSCFALHGMGGVGKTSIALQFAYEVKDQMAWKVVLWFAAEDAPKLAQGFSKVARKLWRREASTNTAQDREDVKEWLASLGKEDSNFPWLSHC